MATLYKPTPAKRGNFKARPPANVNYETLIEKILEEHKDTFAALAK